ncbi:MAG: hypothetical protein Q7V57_02755 [Actinomycetota bacterium]|nr:hypothetical protein [Actinomycetota bacterium]
MKSTNVEAQMRELFTRQAAGVRPGEAEWADIQVVSSASLARRRPTGMLLAAAASLVLLVAVGWVVTRSGTGDDLAGDGGGELPAIDVSSDWVRLTADALVVDVGGQHYTPAGAALEINSDAGSPTYTTLELVWLEHGVEMRINLYFERDVATETWNVTEIRVRDGFPAEAADWVTSTPGTFTLSAPMDTEHRGDLTLQLTDGSRPATLTITGMTLRPFMTFLVHAPDNGDDTVPAVQPTWVSALGPSSQPSTTSVVTGVTVVVEGTTTTTVG